MKYSLILRLVWHCVCIAIDHLGQAAAREAHSPSLARVWNKEFFRVDLCVEVTSTNFSSMDVGLFLLGWF